MVRKLFWTTLTSLELDTDQPQRVELAPNRRALLAPQQEEHDEAFAISQLCRRQAGPTVGHHNRVAHMTTRLRSAAQHLFALPSTPHEFLCSCSHGFGSSQRRRANWNRRPMPGSKARGIHVRSQHGAFVTVRSRSAMGCPKNPFVICNMEDKYIQALPSTCGDDDGACQNTLVPEKTRAVRSGVVLWNQIDGRRHITPWES